MRASRTISVGVLVMMLAASLLALPVAASVDGRVDAAGLSQAAELGNSTSGIPSSSGPSTSEPAPRQDYVPPNALNASGDGSKLTRGLSSTPAASSSGAPSPAGPFGLPDWTYKPDQATIQDPINVVFYGSAWTVVRDALINRGWFVTTCQNEERVYYAGSWRAQNVGLVRDESSPCAILPGSTRRHIRLWGLESGLVVGAAHLDYQPLFGHVAVLFEEIEEEVARYMRLPDTSAWRVQEDNSYYLFTNLVDEMRNGYHTFNNGYGTVLRRQTGATANIFDGLTTTLLEIRFWGGIREFNNHQVQVYSISGSVRWSLWYGQTYSSGTVVSGGVSTVNYPHWTAWTMTTWFQDVSSANMGAIMCKENDGYLGCITLSGGYTANVGNNVVDSLLVIPSFGSVTDTGSSSDNRRVKINSFGGVVEWALWHQGSYTQNEAPSVTYATFPDAKFFMIYIWRMNVEPQYYTGDFSGVLLCREDYNVLGCMVHSTGVKANTGDSTVDILNQISAIGGVRDTGDPVKTHTVRLYAASGSAIEGAYWTEGAYTPHDAPAGTTWDFTFAHYRFFVFVAARYGRLIWLFCRENDNRLGCAPLRWF